MRFTKILSAMTLAAVVGTTACSNDRGSITDPTQATVKGGAAHFSSVIGHIDAANQDASTVCSAVATEMGGGPYDALRPIDNEPATSPLSTTYTFVDGSAVLFLDETGTVINWSTNFMWDYAVIHGGPNGSNVYGYEANGFGSAPSWIKTNKSGTSVQQPGFSNITFCVGPNSMHLDASATASTSYDRKYDWTITKTPDQQFLSLAAGGSSNVTWTVAVNSTSSDINHTISGTVTVTNNTYLPAGSVAVSVSLSGGATPACAIASTISGGGGSATCSFTQAVGDATDQTVSATATATPQSGASASALADFGDPTNLIDNSVDVSDSFNSGAATTIMSGVSGSGSTSYSTTVSAPAAGYYDPCPAVPDQVNKATFTTNTTATSGSASAVVTVTVGGNCGNIIVTPPQPPNTCGIYSQGYWKNHTNLWTSTRTDLLGGQTWIKIFNTSANGNAWTILAYQFMASVLNGTSNANVAHAQALLTGYTQSAVAGKTFSAAVKADFTATAKALETYIQTSEAGCAAYLAWVQQYGGGH